MLSSSDEVTGLKHLPRPPPSILVSVQEVDRAKLEEAGCDAVFEPISLYHQGVNRLEEDATMPLSNL